MEPNKFGGINSDFDPGGESLTNMIEQDITPKRKDKENTQTTKEIEIAKAKKKNKKKRMTE